jgi:hypothetical protein
MDRGRDTQTSSRRSALTEASSSPDPDEVQSREEDFLRLTKWLMEFYGGGREDVLEAVLDEEVGLGADQFSELGLAHVSMWGR